LENWGWQICGAVAKRHLNRLPQYASINTTAAHAAYQTNRWTEVPKPISDNFADYARFVLIAALLIGDSLTQPTKIQVCQDDDPSRFNSSSQEPCM